MSWQADITVPLTVRRHILTISKSIEQKTFFSICKSTKVLLDYGENFQLQFSNPA